MTKLPYDRKRFYIVKSNFSTVLISKRNSKGVYKIVHDKNMFDRELAALQSMNMSLYFTRVINYDRSRRFMYIERGEVVFDMFHDMASKIGIVPYDIASAFTTDLLSALEHLHATGLCHGDIKLENMIRSRDGKFKLFDLGLSCLATKFKSRVGSMNYLPPEGFKENVTIDGHKSDIWSSGICIFSTWCCMKAPWHAANTVMDQKLSNGSSSYWTILSQYNIVEYCYNLCHYLGPSYIIASMLRLEPCIRCPADKLLQRWKVMNSVKE